MGLLTNTGAQKPQQWLGSEAACAIPNSDTGVWWSFQPVPNLNIQALLLSFYSLPHCEEELHTVRVYPPGALILELAPLDATVK